MKFLVTGATGFKGAWLCSWLNILGAKVFGIGFNPNQNKSLFYKLKLEKKIHLKILDIRNYKALNNRRFDFFNIIIYEHGYYKYLELWRNFHSGSLFQIYIFS